MRYFVTLVWLLLLCGTAESSSYCTKAHLLLPTTVRITVGGKDVPQGTAWFVDDTHLATIGHVAHYLFPDDAWVPLDLFQVNPEKTPGQRTEHVLGRRAGTLRTDAGDDITVIELDRPFPNAHAVRIRETLPAVGEHVVIIGFPRGMLRIGMGRYLGQAIVVRNGFLTIGNDMRLELEDRYRRGVFVEGSSGSAIFDCDGYIVGVLNTYLTKNEKVSCDAIERGCNDGYKNEAITPPRGNVTNFSVPVLGLGVLLEALRTPNGT